MTTPSALSPEQSPEQSRDGSSDPTAGREPALPAATDAAGREGTGHDEGRTENELRTLLGLGPVDRVVPRALRIRSWAVTGVVGIIAALLRLIGLGHPKTLMFDEIYYVKDAYTLWHLGYEANWAADSDAAFAAGDFSGMSREASYVVTHSWASGSSVPEWRSSGRRHPSAGASCQPLPGSRRSCC